MAESVTTARAADPTVDDLSKHPQGGPSGGWRSGGKVRTGGKVRNLGDTFAHLVFGVFCAWEMGKVRKWLGMCVYPFA